MKNVSTRSDKNEWCGSLLNSNTFRRDIALLVGPDSRVVKRTHEFPTAAHMHGIHANPKYEPL